MTKHDLERKIEAFLQEWPDAEYGPAHIVLGDYNLGDGHLNWCIAIARAVLSGKSEDLPHRGDLDFMEQLNWYRPVNREELEATISFLQELLAMPEERHLYELWAEQGCHD